MGAGRVAWIALMSGHYRLSTRCIQSLLESQWGLSFSLGAISEAQGPVGAWLEPLHEQVGEAVRQAPVAHADETTHYREQRRHWLWVLCTAHAAYFVVHASRGKKAARALLGGFMGILLTDRHGGYNDYPAPLRQVCWAHVIRNLKAQAGRKGEAGALGEWLVRVARLAAQRLPLTTLPTAAGGPPRQLQERPGTGGGPARRPAHGERLRVPAAGRGHAVDFPGTSRHSVDQQHGRTSVEALRDLEENQLLQPVRPGRRLPRQDHDRNGNLQTLGHQRLQPASPGLRARPAQPTHHGPPASAPYPQPAKRSRLKTIGERLLLIQANNHTGSDRYEPHQSRTMRFQSQTASPGAPEPPFQSQTVA
jgi:hypothetical protein